MYTMRSRIARKWRAFTLVELVTAMAITAILVFVIMQLTNQSVGLWKLMREDTNSAATARSALQTIAHDMESFQMRQAPSTDGKKVQWLSATQDRSMKGIPRGLSIPRSARCIFFVCAPDRNPAVSSSPSMRSTYRNVLASSTNFQGDISAVSYRLLFRDHILNLAARRGDTESFPLFSLYRQVVSPRLTFDSLLGQEDLNSAYSQFERGEEKSFLCENIVELNLNFNIEYTEPSSSKDTVVRNIISVPVLSSKSRQGSGDLYLYGDHAEFDGTKKDNARIVSAEISITVLTEEGVALVEQVRLGQRRAPKLEEFFTRYTRSYSRLVSLPAPL